ncbi:MAG: sensor histidine kinase [Dehalococcoidia bacterium]
MLTNARLRLTLVYGVFFGLIVVAVAGLLTISAIQETRRRDDLELRLRAEDLVRQLQLPGADLQHEAHEAGERLEGQGILTFVFPVRNGVVEGSPTPGSGLPALAAAQRAVSTNTARFDTVDVAPSDVRVYSLPTNSTAASPQVVQVARSLYFADRSVRRLLLATIAIGGITWLAAMAGAYWLAGRTLRPISRALVRQQAFAADASHELRTPLSVVLGNAELLARHPDAAIGAYGDVVEDIVAESRRLTRLVADLLTLARSDSGQIPLSEAGVDLSQLGATLIRQFTPLAQQQGLQLVPQIQADIHVRGDGHWLHELGVILLDNAVRYTAEGEVRLRIERDAGGVCLEVTDTGRGIPAEHLSRLTERFYRVDAARAADHGGTGLGLAIAAWIVQGHHGKLAITSVPGSGSTFCVRLP